MKKLNLYLISVNLYGPHPYRKSGSGNWVVCETSPENALKVLQKYLSDNNLIGMSGHASLIYKGFPLDTEILPRRHVMQFTEYKERVYEKTHPEKYIFSPKKTENGIKLYKIVREPMEYRSPFVNGAYGQKDENIEKEDFEI